MFHISGGHNISLRAQPEETTMLYPHKDAGFCSATWAGVAQDHFITPRHLGHVNKNTLIVIFPAYYQN